ncbi:MAG: shikimate kinase [Akkermansia sp.]|nr:shikimate kinase [Akkermansia sp.]MBQ7024779.1 shikimate kinase [Akkermansia sp.]
MEPCFPIDTKGHPIILIGLMGCGKTTIGKELSRMTCMPLIDMDSIIEEQIGKSISDIFRDEGEAHFRALETALLRYIEGTVGTEKGSVIISTGGGVVLKPINRELLRRIGFTVWFNVDVPTLLERTSRSNNRPLLQRPDRAAIMERLYRERTPLYAEAAHLRLDSSHISVRDTVPLVHEAALRFFGN